MSDSIKADGGCICGGVRYQVSDHTKLRQVIACHCEQCRRFSGNFIAATSVRHQYFSFINQDTLNWYSYLPNVRQGFCRECGSSLFFDYPKQSRISIAAGSLDDSYDLKLVAQIFCKEAGNYYEVSSQGEIIDDINHAIECPS